MTKDMLGKHSGARGEEDGLSDEYFRLESSTMPWGNDDPGMSSEELCRIQDDFYESQPESIFGSPSNSRHISGGG